MKDLRCPLCQLPLLPNPQGLSCDNRHQFDRAKEGYFNLLPVQNKHSREPGDAKEQLQARRQFLQAGFFEPLKSKLQAVVPAGVQSLLDIGCGEGYFTRGFADVLPETQIYGIDIAKAGVRLAAKSVQEKNRQLFVVASSFDLPVADHSIDVITRIYAPSKDAELWRVIKPGGLLIIVTPAENHLLGLRHRIYQKVRMHQQPPMPEGFDLFDQYRVTGSLQINMPELCAALLSMTPFAWRLPVALRNEIIAGGITDEADFMITLYHPRLSG